MINIYWFVSNEMVRQHIDKYTNVRHNMQVMTGLVHRHSNSGPPFLSFGPSRDYGMDLCLQVYL